MFEFLKTINPVILIMAIVIGVLGCFLFVFYAKVAWDLNSRRIRHFFKFGKKRHRRRTVPEYEPLQPDPPPEDPKPTR